MPPGAMSHTLDDLVGVGGRHRWTDRRDVMPRSHLGELIDRWHAWPVGDRPRLSRGTQVAHEVTERAIVMDRQDPGRMIANHTERVGHTARHRHPVARLDDELLVATAGSHAAFDRIPRIVERLMDVERRRVADRQRHLEHDRGHLRSHAMLDHEAIEEPPCNGLLLALHIDGCGIHHLTPHHWATAPTRAPGCHAQAHEENARSAWPLSVGARRCRPHSLKPPLLLPASPARPDLRAGDVPRHGHACTVRQDSGPRVSENRGRQSRTYASWAAGRMTRDGRLVRSPRASPGGHRARRREPPRMPGRFRRWATTP